MQPRSGALVNLGEALVSKMSSYSAPEKVNIPIALLIAALDETALILTTAGALRWTMRYRCETLA